MFATRVLDYGYPKIHGERNVVYSLWQRDGVGIHEATDAYTGSPWLQYYVGAIGVWIGNGGDLYARTAWVRAPFALAAALGLTLLGGLVRSRLAPAQRATGLAVYALGIAFSVALLLHLREARYYGLALALIAGALWLWERHLQAPSVRVEAGLAACLVALFHAFHPAFAALGGALAVRAGAGGPAPGRIGRRARATLRAQRAAAALCRRPRAAGAPLLRLRPADPGLARALRRPQWGAQPGLRAPLPRPLRVRRAGPRAAHRGRALRPTRPRDGTAAPGRDARHARRGVPRRRRPDPVPLRALLHRAGSDPARDGGARRLHAVGGAAARTHAPRRPPTLPRCVRSRPAGHRRCAMARVPRPRRRLRRDLPRPARLRDPSPPGSARGPEHAGRRHELRKGPPSCSISTVA